MMKKLLRTLSLVICMAVLMTAAPPAETLLVRAVAEDTTAVVETVPAAEPAAEPQPEVSVATEVPITAPTEVPTEAPTEALTEKPTEVENSRGGY